jgi:hypothetical protein
MPRVVRRVAQSIRQFVRLVVIDGLEQRQRALGIRHGVERLDHFPVAAARHATLIEKLGVLFRNVGGVAQHPTAKVDGGGRGVDRAVESVLHQGR